MEETKCIVHISLDKVVVFQGRQKRPKHTKRGLWKDVKRDLGLKKDVDQFEDQTRTITSFIKEI